MKYCITAMVEMVGSYDTEVEANSLEEAKSMAEEIAWDLDVNDVCWSEEVIPYCDCDVSLAYEEEYEVA